MGLLKKAVQYIVAKYYMHKGYSAYYVNFWRKEMIKSYKSSKLPRKEKKWAYKRGFNPYRIAQYGLTEENYKNVISDRDYYYLYPLNNRYSVWIDDKLTMKYVLSPFDSFLPKYYYHIMKDRGVMRLMDCPESCGEGAEGILQLIYESGCVAAKMAAGTYGIGFYKLQYADGKYYANGKKYDREWFKTFLLSLDNYIITEFVEMHPDIKKLNPCSVNTIRLTVINEHGNDPQIAFAFMRIGTKKSGIVDNVAQGGMVCKVDVASGRFYDGEMLNNHIYQQAEFHPDTNEKMEGLIPNWKLVQSEIIKIGNYYPQLKWLGYDIAITQDSFKIIEINSHQGLHKAHMYPDNVKRFLERELITKKAIFSKN